MFGVSLMSKEMNKLMAKVTKYDMICGLFMSLIIGVVLNREIVSLSTRYTSSNVNYIVSVCKMTDKKTFYDVNNNNT
jgi:hypothetical protein